MAVEFNDRRGTAHLPLDADYSTPMERPYVEEANRRFRATGVPGVITQKHRGIADSIVRETSRLRHKERKEFRSVGEYLEFMNSIPEE